MLEGHFGDFARDDGFLRRGNAPDEPVKGSLQAVSFIPVVTLFEGQHHRMRNGKAAPVLIGHGQVGAAAGGV